MGKNLFVDDLRSLPGNYQAEEWDIARTAWEALYLLDTNEYELVSLDHDLASFVNNTEITGYDILMFLVERKINGLCVPTKIKVHSANVVAVPKMEQIIERYFSNDS